MTNSFLYQIAKAYVAQDDVQLRRCLFVFPSRRSSLFFQKYLGQCSTAPLFSPDIVTIGDLFVRLSPYRRGDKIQLMYILWQKYYDICKGLGRAAESFDSFVSLGEAVMADFSDVDKYMADAGKLFAHVKDLRELDAGYGFLDEDQKAALKQFWGVIADGRDSDQRRKFLGLWEILFPLYTAFKEELSGCGVAYEGMLQREVAERILHDEADGIKDELAAYDRIVVVGQNALCKCETALYDYIRREFDGDFYWDFCGECLRDEANKASFFIKNYIERYPSRYKLESEAQGRPEIKVVAASSAVAQAKVAAAELELAGEESTAVVLPDENLLMPLLNSIPENIHNVNVTMGYGLHNSATASLMDMMASLQLNKRPAGFYHKDVTAILNHPFIREAAGDAAGTIKKKVVEGNEIYVPEDRFAGDVILSVLFRPVRDTEGLYGWQMEVLQTLAPSLPDIEKEFAHGYYTSVSHLRDLSVPMEMRTYFKFLREITSRLTVDFRGEPLSGLQVMGPLEVRAIDFDTLIILSVNEGVFPAKQQSDSLIPYNVRRGFGLPTVELFDSIAAYHFYRSIYRAKRVVLIYDSRTKGMMSGEESRFVKQLRYHYGYDIKESSVNLEIRPVEGVIKCVEKTPEVMRQLLDHFLIPDAKGKYNAFSASSLIDYLRCPLKFYYSQIVGLAEEDEVSEDVDASQFGKTFHNTIEALYAPVEGAQVTREWLKSIAGDVELISSTVARYLNKELKRPESSPLSRRNQITANLVSELVLATLRNDMTYAPFTYIGSELRLEKEIPLEIDGKPQRVRLKGFIDRLDRKDGAPRICDYKTGSVHEVNDYLPGKQMEKVFSGELNTSYQLLVYALLMNMENPAQKQYELAVYDVKKLFDSVVQTKYCPPETIDEFKVRLEGTLSDIFNPGIPFRGVEAGNDVCKLCPAKAICGR
ncbi:MAG: PD-(D/E)XK nuclease family protein [Bacteroidales bacterium]|nr:PD-(D/E)XK nuclease family protein [Bacteroidales bacterium]